MPGGLHPPPEVVLSWKPNYVDPVTRGDSFLVAAGVLISLVYLTVLLRLYTRAFVTRNLGIDDILVAINLVPVLGLTVCFGLTHSKFGGDRHVWDNTLPTLIKNRKTTFAIIQIYITTNTLTKVSILLFYRRLTGSTLSAAFRWILYAATAFVIGYWVSFTIVLFADCHPFHAYWNQLNPFWQENYTCLDEPTVIIVASILNVIQDFMCCFLPVVLFWKVQISTRKKVGLFLLFSIGFCVCVTAILRSVYVKQLFSTTFDATWYSDRISLVTLLEVDMGIICASLPAMSSLFRRVASDSQIASRIKATLSTRGINSEFQRTRSYSGTDDRPDTHIVPKSAHRRNPNAINVVEDVMLDEYYLPQRRAPSPTKAYDPSKTWLEDASREEEGKYRNL